MVAALPGHGRVLCMLWVMCVSFSVCTATIAQTAELIVVDQPNCHFCERFEREVAPTWPKTAEGREVPLRRVDLQGPWPDDLAGVARPELTPTFILVESGNELGRLAGYQGEEHFWFLIGQLLAVREDRPPSSIDLQQTDY